MGGEGATWLGQAWFSSRKHVFANLGDGTYYHSGSMAIRAAVAADINITYKILFNDAVAMTGGQPVDGPLTVPRIANQLAAEGVRRIALVAEDPSRWNDRSLFPVDGPDLVFTLHHRDSMDAVQRDLSLFVGVSVLIFDQVCAAEKRRRRKKGTFPQALQRVFINEAVCEGCGDCGVQSNCTSLMPQATEYGLKRRIDQSSCNADYSCIKGFCPSFVSVEGVTPRKSQSVRLDAADFEDSLPEPSRPPLQKVRNILITGIGGTGVITIGALLGMAAHLEGKGISVLDMTGMSQKNGSVTSHVRIARKASDIKAQRIPTGEADLLLGCDMLTAGAPDAISRMHSGRTYALVNTFEQPTGQFAQDPNWVFPAHNVQSLLSKATGSRVDFLDATSLATRLFGDAITVNLFMLGFAYQKGQIPVSSRALLKAIEINGVAIKANQVAFRWGRKAAIDLAAVTRIANPDQSVQLHRPQTLEALIESSVTFLKNYQSETYANRYRAWVAQVHSVEQRHHKSTLFTRAVASALFKLMAYKDEYEVARLYTDGRFRAQLAREFEGTPKLRFHLAPPVFNRRSTNGHPVKTSYGPWMWHFFRLLAPMRFLRGTLLDPFGFTSERRQERQQIQDYETWLADFLPRFAQADFETAVSLAKLPEQIRGYGHVKQEALRVANVRREVLLGKLFTPRSGSLPELSGDTTLTSRPTEGHHEMENQA
jgi:indolepyruvate ferredoxin oxidoreductase